jgi:hypothetical protein
MAGDIQHPSFRPHKQSHSHLAVGGAASALIRFSCHLDDFGRFRYGQVAVATYPRFSSVPVIWTISGGFVTPGETRNCLDGDLCR